MRKYVLAVLALAAAMACAMPAAADDVTLNFSLDGVGSAYVQSANHDDQDLGYGYKGWATLILENTSNTPWSDLHVSLFAVVQPFGAIFQDASMGGMNPTYELNGVSKPVSWAIDNAAVGGPTMDLVFADFVGIGDIAKFKVYTNNMATQTMFRLSVYPTADYVPEPSSLLAISTAMVGFVGLMRRRRN